MIVGNPIIMILKAILNWFRLRRDYIANAVDKIPPEIKDALVAWYSPVKQKLSNYDVIESYIIDFTTFNNRDDAIINNNKFVFTGNVVVGINYERIQVEKYNSYKILIKGLTGGIYYYYRNVDGVENYIIFNKDGVYDIPVSYKQGTEGIIMGYRCNSTTECTVTQLPTSILKDFSGNRHDAYLYGFKGRLNSGVGIYKIDFSKTLNLSAFDNFERLNNKVIAKGNYSGNWNVFGEYDINGIVKNKVTIKITGLNNIKEKLSLEYGYYTTDSKYIKNIILIDKDGIYTYDLNDIIIPDESNIAHTIYNRMYFGEQIINDINLIVEEIPDYSNQLCYDGKSYGVAYDMPILTDYTIIANRTWFAEKVFNGIFMSKALEQNGAFIFEYKQNDKWVTYSYYSATNINIDKDNSIVYQTKNKYNEQTIYPGDKQDTDTLFIGTIRKDDTRTFIGCHGDILLFNRTLTDNELDLVKEHFFGIIRIKDALMTTDKKYLALTNDNVIQFNNIKNNNYDKQK